MNKVYQRINWQNEPSISTPLNETNLNKIDYALDVVDGRVVTFDTTKANQSDLLQTVKTVAYNTTTGVFTFTFWNGNTVTADLNIEKIPIDFSMDEYGVITMTTADGTTYTCDISELIKLYTFNDSSEIDFTTTTDQSGNKTITASIVSGSITGDKLQPNYLADCVSAKNGAETAETNAGQSAIDSEMSSEDSEAWAVGERNGQPVPSTDPTYQNNAKWWAQHGTGSSFAGLSDTNFTNLQGGQIARYDDVTQKWINTEDEGGLLPHFKITSEAGSTVTVVCPDTSVITPTQTSSGIWQCDVPAYGVYTVHAVINGDDAVRTVTVDTVKEYVIHDEHYSYTLNVYAPTGSSIIVTDGGSETYTGTGAGSTAVIFALHQASTTYTITVDYDGLDSSTTITSSATTGGSGSKTIEFGTINLTLDEDLIGETITMAKGTDTVSKVASSTSMVFYPNATGNWTISCQYEGETYYSEPNPVVVSSLSTAVSAEISLVHIPEGATVTPTDDIQTWLACANITDKSYTTLAEVLADRETFETLIADSNACDYMARSTSWATGSASGLVPTMTSATTPSGVVTGSTNYDANYPNWHAFDRNDSSITVFVTGTTNNYITYEFPSAVKVDTIDYLPRDCNIATSIGFYGSNDNSEWTELITSSISEIKVYTLKVDNPAEYKYYKYVALAGQGDTVRIQYYFKSLLGNQDAMALIGKYDYCSNALLNNATWCEAIANSDYFEEVLNVKVPVMTSNTTPSGTVLKSREVSSFEAYKAFDKNNSTVWIPIRSTTSIVGDFIGYAFTSPVCIKKVKIIGNRFKNATIQASNDGTTYTPLKNIDLGGGDSDFSVDEILDNDISYTHYMLKFTSASTNVDCHISELQFYGRASSNVSNTNGIIHTAMGNDSVYCVETGDTFTATDGIATVDFSDFDEGVYTFGSTTAKNPNDLSEDFKKRIRITKSPYGGTTERYLLPDTIDTLYWYGYEDDNFEDMTSANGWSRSTYTFSTPTHNTTDIDCNANGNQVISGIGSKNKITSLTRCYAIAQGVTAVNSSYGNTKTEPSKAVDASTSTSQVLYNTNTSKFYQGNLEISNNYLTACSIANRRCKVSALWYTRGSNDIPTFISAANDTLYIMDGSNKIYIANTNGEGKSYEPLLEAGTYTIYSSVAKDPNNLSNPYSKTVTVDESTQMIAVMPDTVKTLYWWGYESSNLENCTTSNGWSPSSGHTWNDPTHNTNKITITGTQNKVVGIGNKTAISPTVIHSICECTLNNYGGDNHFTYLYSTSTKSVNGALTVTNTQKNKLEHIYANATNSYFVIYVSDVRTSDIYAMWYE